MRLIASCLVLFGLSVMIGHSQEQKNAGNKAVEGELVTLQPRPAAGWDTRDLEKYFVIIKPIQWDGENKTYSYSALLQAKQKGILAGRDYHDFEAKFQFKTTYYDSDGVKIHEGAPRGVGASVFTVPYKWEKDEPIRFRYDPRGEMADWKILARTRKVVFSVHVVE